MNERYRNRKTLHPNEAIAIAKLRQAYPNLSTDTRDLPIPTDDKMDTLIKAMKQRNAYFTRTVCLWRVLEQADELIANYVPTADERKDFYAKRRNQAVERANANVACVERDDDYQAVQKQISSLSAKLGFAEYRNDPTLPQLCEHMQELLHQKELILSRYGLTEADLTVHPICPACHDTGVLPDGNYCGCYAN